MSDNVNIIVQDTINEIVVNTAVVVETIDINVQVAVDEVNIIANPNNYVVNINRIIGEQVQSDWNQNDDQEPDYIKNKPSIPTLTSDLTNDGEDGINPFITANDVTPQVNSDWNATSGVAKILNKPTIPSIAGLATVVYVDEQDALKVDKVAGSRLITSAESTLLGNTSGINTGDQDLSNLVVKNTAIVGATKTKITFDAKGLVTSGADATTADIADSLDKRYVTDANLTTIGNQSGVNTGDQDLSGLTPNTRSISTTTPLQGGGDLSANRTLSILQSNTTQSGFLSNTDWNTFNGKFNLPSLTSGSVLFSNGTTIAQDNANLFWDDTNNRLGIGTASPTNAKLKVSGAGATASIMSEDTTSTTSFVRVLGDISSQNLFNWQSGTALRFATSNQDYSSFSERMRITSTGNVGIGTTAPTAKLHIAAPGALSTDIALRVRNSADSADLMTVNGLGNVTLGAGGYIYGDTTTPYLRLSQTNGSFLVYGNSGLGLYGSLADIYSTDRITFQTNSSEKMRITSTGNVGIGTTAPATKLDVNGVGTFMASNTPTLLTKISGSYGQVITMARNGAGNNVGLGVAESGELSFYTNNVETMRIHSNGSLLIGTTTLIGSSKLTIQSTTQGFLPPRMTNAQRIAIATPAVGLCVYCTDVVEGLYINKSTGWTYIG